MLLRGRRANRASGIQKTQVPAHEIVPDEHPGERAEGEVGTEGKLRRPDPLADQHCRHPYERADKRAGEDAKKHRAPAEKSTDRSEELQITAPHRFARN